MGHDLILSRLPSVPCNGGLFLVSIAEKIGLTPLTVAPSLGLGAVDSRLKERERGDRKYQKEKERGTDKYLKK